MTGSKTEMALGTWTEMCIKADTRIGARAGSDIRAGTVSGNSGGGTDMGLGPLQTQDDHLQN